METVRSARVAYLVWSAAFTKSDWSASKYGVEKSTCFLRPHVIVTASAYSVGIDVETRHRLRILRYVEVAADDGEIDLAVG